MPLDRKPMRPKVSTLPLGTEVGNFILLAHDLENNKVYVHCKRCTGKAWLNHKQFYTKQSCGCISADPITADHGERGAVKAMNDRIDFEKAQYIPLQLREHWRFRSISPRWHKDNPDKFINFVMDVGHRPPNARAAWIDPAGDFIPENFYWKLNDRPDTSEAEGTA